MHILALRLLGIFFMTKGFGLMIHTKYFPKAPHFLPIKLCRISKLLSIFELLPWKYSISKHHITKALPIFFTIGVLGYCLINEVVNLRFFKVYILWFNLCGFIIYDLRVWDLKLKAIRFMFLGCAFNFWGFKYMIKTWNLWV